MEWVFGLGVTQSSRDPLTAFRVINIMTSPEIEPFKATLGYVPMHEPSIDVYVEMGAEECLDYLEPRLRRILDEQ